MSKVSKVVYGDTTVIDITDSTVNANNLLSGNKAYGADGEPVFGALSVGSTVNVTTTDSTIFGETLTLSDGTTTLSTTFDNSGDATFENVLLTGNLTLACQGYEMSITILTYDTYNITFITIPRGETVTPTDDIQTWLHCANIFDKSYTTLAEVLADEETYEILLRDSNACDYMARSTSWAGNSTVKIPNMTSATAPSGVVTAQSEYSTSYYGYFAFNGSTANNGWCPNASATANNTWVQYEFPTPVVVNYAQFYQVFLSSTITYDKTIKWKVYGSLNGTDFTPISDEITITEWNTWTGSNFDNTTAYKYFRYVITGASGSTGAGITSGNGNKIQVYHKGITTNETAMRYLGKYDYACEKLLGNATWTNAIANSDYWEYVFNYSVPKMTSNTTPRGTVSASSVGSGSNAYYAFDRNDSTSWYVNGANNPTSYVRYVSPSSFKAYYAKIKFQTDADSGYTMQSVTFKLQSSTDGTTYNTELGEVATTATTGTTRVETKEIFFGEQDVLGFQLYATGNTLPSGNTVTRVLEIQFYGRKPISNNYISLVPVMTSDTTPLGEAFRSTGISGGDAYKAFDSSSSTYASVTYATDAYVGYHFTSPKVVDRCSFLATSTTTAVFALDASNNGTDWTTLGTLNGSSSGYTSTNYTLDVQNTTAYSYYRTRISQKGSESWTDYAFYTIEFLSKLDKTIVHSTPLDTIYYMSNGTPITVCTTDSNGIGEFDLADFSDATYTLYSSVAKDPSNLSNDFSKAIRITKTQWGGTTELYLMPSTINTLYWWGYINNLETANSTNGWSSSAGFTPNTVTYNTNSISQVSVSHKYAIVGSSTKVTATKLHSIGYGSTEGAILQLPNKNINSNSVGGVSAYSTSNSHVVKDYSGNTYEGYLVSYLNTVSSQTLIVYAIWYE